MHIMRGLYEPERDVISVKGKTYQESSLQYNDNSVGTLTWRHVDPSCQKEYSEVYSGKATYYKPVDPEEDSAMVLISDSQEGRYAGINLKIIMPIKSNQC